MEKYIELARKLKALADGASGGEKYNAQQRLDALMKKHGITMEDIEIVEQAWMRFIVKRGLTKLLFQVASSVIGDNACTYKQSRTNKNHIFFNVTKIEAVEIEAKYDFYSKLYRKELDIFYAAFVQKNGIFNINKAPVDVSELPFEEIAKAERIMEMAEVIESGRYRKNLSAGVPSERNLSAGITDIE